MPTDEGGAAELERAVRRCRLELAAVRRSNETLSENQANADRARDQLARLAGNVDARLTKSERASSGWRGRVKRALNRRIPTPEEQSQAREIRRSSLFDGVWYLSTYPEVAKTGLSPALHYLRVGAKEGKDPGPTFSTRHYVGKHPQIARTGTNPLLNHLRTGQ